MSRVENFVERWQEAWRLMDPDTWAEIYHQQGTLLQPGMARPIVRSEIPAHVGRINALLPDIKCDMRNWAAIDSTVFTEWTITAHLLGQPIEWSGCDRFTLADGHAMEEVVHFDTLPLWASLEPTMKRGGLLPGIGSPASVVGSLASLPGPVPAPNPDAEQFMRGYSSLWRSADPALIDTVYHPAWRGRSPTIGPDAVIERNDLYAYCKRTKTMLPDCRLEVVRWAARAEIVFIEWFVEGTLGGERIRWEGIDRQTLFGHQSIDGVSYFDSLAVWSRLDPSMKRPFLLAAASELTGG